MSDKGLTRNDILNSIDRPREEVYLPRWGGSVYVTAAAMAHPRYVRYTEGTHKERESYGGELPQREQLIRQNVGAVIMWTTDADGNRLFDWSDEVTLRNKHWNSVVEIAARIFYLAGGLDFAEDDPPEITPEADDTAESDEADEEALHGPLESVVSD